ncbi:hypothetical protein ACJJTC_002467 [Scirpophaga incertulas]
MSNSPPDGKCGLRTKTLQTSSQYIRTHLVISLYVGERLNSKHLMFDGASKPIYITEALTTKAQKLFFLAREFARENEFKYCWTSRGIVFLRKADKQPPIRIESEKDLTKLSQK